MISFNKALINFWVWLGGNKDQITIVIAIIAGLWILFEYYDRVDKAKIKETLKYVDRFQKNKVFHSKTALRKFWLEPENRAKLDEHQIDQWPKLATKMVKSHKDQEEYLLTVLDFYRDVSLCALSDVCHKKKTCEYFGNSIYDFNFLYGDMINEWEKDWRQNFDLEIKSFLDDLCEGLIDKSPYKN